MVRNPRRGKEMECKAARCRRPISQPNKPSGQTNTESHMHSVACFISVSCFVKCLFISAPHMFRIKCFGYSLYVDVIWCYMLADVMWARGLGNIPILNCWTPAISVRVCISLHLQPNHKHGMTVKSFAMNILICV